MPSSIRCAVILFASLLGATACNAKASPAGAVPAPLQDAPRATTAGQQTAVVSGGCFWGVQAVFQHVKGVISATSGYSGGSAKTAEYEIVSTGETGHAESVQIVYDPSQITYGELLRVFFSVAHDPTATQSSGSRRGHAIPFLDLLQQRRTETHRRGVHCPTRQGESISAVRSSPRSCRCKPFTRPKPITRTTPRCIPTSPTSCSTTLPRSRHLRQEFPDLYTGK